jgi:hypothetical protein
MSEASLSLHKALKVSRYVRSRSVWCGKRNVSAWLAMAMSSPGLSCNLSTWKHGLSKIDCITCMITESASEGRTPFACRMPAEDAKSLNENEVPDGMQQNAKRSDDPTSWEINFLIYTTIPS